MCKFKLNLKEYYTDRFYPNQINTNYRYDFYFPEINVFVEIAGIDNPEYILKMQRKKELFNPYIIYSREEIPKFINLIAEKFNRLQNEH